MEPDSARRKKVRIVGYAMIFFGIVGPLVGYFVDAHSFDVARMWDAAPTAILQALVFVGCGALVILWSYKAPNDSDDDYRPGGPV